MNAYRDELSAALERARALEGAVARGKRRIDELEASVAERDERLAGLRRERNGPRRFATPRRATAAVALLSALTIGVGAAIAWARGSRSPVSVPAAPLAHAPGPSAAESTPETSASRPPAPLFADPAPADRFAEEAARYELAGDVVRAEDAWRRAVAERNDDASWQFHFGETLREIGKDDQAHEHLERAVELAVHARGAPPKWLWRAYLQLAHLASERNDPDGARDAYAKFAKLAPRSAVRREPPPDAPPGRQSSCFCRDDDLACAMHCKSDRERLTAKLSAGTASDDELRMLKAICIANGDGVCRDAARRALDRRER